MIEIIVTYEIYHSEYNNTTRARYYHIMSVKYHLKSKMANNKKQLSAAEIYWAEYICLILFQCMLTTFGLALKTFLRSEINDPQTNLKFEGVATPSQGVRDSRDSGLKIHGPYG